MWAKVRGKICSSAITEKQINQNNQTVISHPITITLGTVPFKLIAGAAGDMMMSLCNEGVLSDLRSVLPQHV